MVTITVQPQDQQVILGGTLDLSVTATGNGTLHYQWKHGVVNVGSDSASYQDADFQDADRGSYTVDITDDDETKTSDAANVTVEPDITVQPVSDAVIIGGHMELSVTATGHSPITYQWKKGVDPLLDETNISLIIDPFADEDRGSYTCEVTCDGNTVESDPAVITVEPNITVQPQSGSVIIGDPMELSVTATGHSPITYQWKKGVDPLLDETNDTLTIDPYTDDDRGSYTVEVTCDGNTVESDPAVITTELNISVQPQNQKVVLGGTLDLSVTASGRATLHYQWKKDGDNIGTDSSTYQKLSFEDTDRGSYTVEITDGYSNVLESNPAVVTVNPEITTQPQQQQVVLGGHLELSVIATGHSPITYQWKIGGSPVLDETSDTLIIDPFTVDDRGNYTVDVTCDGNTVTSDIASVTVQPEITLQPVSQAVEIDGSFELVVEATGHDLTYQWYKNDSPLLDKTDANLVVDPYADSDRGDYRVEVTSDGNMISSDVANISTQPHITVQPIDTASEIGALAELTVTATGHPTLLYQWYKDSELLVGEDSDTLSFASFAEEDRGTYYVTVVSDGNIVQSDDAIMSVLPTIVTDPQSQNHILGDEVTFTVEATGFAPLTYQWKQNGSPILDATNSEYVIDSFEAADRGNYTCDVTCDGNTVESGIAILKVIPVIVTQPVSQSAMYGDEVTLSVVATGYSPITYQWNKGGNPILDETESSLIINPFAESDRGSYTCEVTCDTNTIESDSAILTVQPKINTQPASQEVSVGSALNLFVIAVGHSPMTYQWRKDFVPLAGETNFTFEIASFALTDAGAYDCLVSCDGNTTRSNSAIVSMDAEEDLLFKQLDFIKRTYMDKEGIFFKINGDTLSFSGSNPEVIEWRNPLLPGFKLVETFTYQGSTVDTTTREVKIDDTDPGYLPIINQNPVSGSYNIHDEITLTVEATGTGTLHYQWSKDNVNVGTDSDTLDIADAALTDAGGYRCVVSNAFGSVLSTIAVISVAGVVPVVTVDPSGQSIGVGDTLTLTVTATGTAPLHYQWKQDGSNVGTDSNTYEKIDAQESDSGDYTCVVTNDFGSDTSGVATVVVGGSELGPFFSYYFNNINNE